MSFGARGLVKTYGDGSFPAVTRGKSLERLRKEHGGVLPLAQVMRVVDVLLFHMEQGHKRGMSFRHLHAASIMRLDDDSLVVESAERSHANPPEADSTINEQSDVFVVGALVFYLLTGAEPQVSPHGPLPALETLAPWVPARVARAIGKALHPRRAVRWLDVSELRDALFGDEGARCTLPVGFERPAWATELMDAAMARRAK